MQKYNYDKLMLWSIGCDAPWPQNTVIFLLFSPKHGGSSLLWNAGDVLSHYTESVGKLVSFLRMVLDTGHLKNKFLEYSGAIFRVYSPCQSCIQTYNIQVYVHKRIFIQVLLRFRLGTYGSVGKIENQHIFMINLNHALFLLIQ